MKSRISIIDSNFTSHKSEINTDGDISIVSWHSYYITNNCQPALQESINNDTVWNSETAETRVWFYCVLSIADVSVYTSPCNAQEERRLPTPRITSHGYSPSKQLRRNYFIKTSLLRKKHQTNKKSTQKHTIIWPAQKKNQNNYCT